LLIYLIRFQRKKQLFREKKMAHLRIFGTIHKIDGKTVRFAVKEDRGMQGLRGYGTNGRGMGFAKKARCAAKGRSKTPTGSEPPAGAEKKGKRGVFPIMPSC
jgi:hypothetical protein